jgi:long-chain acyl-CoA synthetase
MRMHLVPLLLGSHMTEEECELALQTCGAAALLTSEELPSKQPANFKIRLTQNDDPTIGPSLYDTDFLKLTSGTTSRPRAVRFTAAQLVADCDNICETMGIAEADLNFGVIPFSHSYGFSNLITPLLCRGVPLVASEDRMPRAILNDLDCTGATVFPGMPVFFEKLAAMESGPALGRLRLCISAGAPLTARVGEAFSARYGLKIHTFYGSSECGGIGYDASDEPVYEDGFAGCPMKNVEITPLCEGIGQIAVRSAAVGQGYFPEPVPETLGAGRFIPGDLVRMGARGMYLAGRDSDVINVASALRTEEAVACVSGSAPAAEVLRYARGVLSGWQVPKDIWLVDEVPVNDRGKISRKELARAYAEMRR